MKRPHALSICLFLLAIAAAQPMPAHAQFGKLKDKIKQKVDDKVKKGEASIDKKIDCALDEVFRDGKCVKKTPAEAAATSGSAGATTSAAAKVSGKPGEGAWANFDFVPGEKVL